MTISNNIDPILPDNLLHAAYSLDDSGNLAWDYENVKKLLEFLKKNGRLILGGEVYTLSKERIDLTWDSWEYEPDPALSREANVQNSYEDSVHYLDSHRKKFGDDFCYSVVFK